MKKLPPDGMSSAAIISRLKKYREQDIKYKTGHCFGLMYYPPEDAASLINSVYSEYLFENALNPYALPSLFVMEQDIINMLIPLFNGTNKTCGSITSGGSESIILAVKCAREVAQQQNKQINEMEILIPESAHPAFSKAAGILNLKINYFKTKDDKTADVVDLENKISTNTIFVAASAPNYPYGIIDPVEELASITRNNKIWLHVDACIGGFILPFLREVQQFQKFDFSVKGVNSISVDLHKYGYAPKGTSVLLHRDKSSLQNQFFVKTDWVGGFYLTPGISGSRSGASIAAAWSILHYFGEKRYRQLALETYDATQTLVQKINDIDGLKVISNPFAGIIAFTSEIVPVKKISTLMRQNGWHLEVQQNPGALHITITYPNFTIIEKFVAHLSEAASFLSHNPKYH
jgi:sphinganine-1-phosphate aldolase